jgi:DNA uptake protein ComE-like DNA-binding protein
MDEHGQTLTDTEAPRGRRLLEIVAVLLLACAILGSVGVIAWRRYHLGKEISVVESPTQRFLVNVNRAGKEELMLLPGIGEVRAERIIATRQKGAFVSLEEVRMAADMGRKQFQPAANLITLGEPGQAADSDGP